MNRNGVDLFGRTSAELKKAARRALLIGIGVALFNAALLVGVVLGICYGVKVIFFS